MSSLLAICHHAPAQSSLLGTASARDPALSGLVSGFKLLWLEIFILVDEKPWYVPARYGIGSLSFREAGNEAEAWSGMKDSSSVSVPLPIFAGEDRSRTSTERCGMPTT